MRKTLILSVAFAGLAVLPTMAWADPADDRDVGAAVGEAAGTAAGAPVGGPGRAAIGGAIGGTVGAGVAGPRRDDRVIIETQPPISSERTCVENADTKKCVEIRR